jgi:hypothetical protein
MDSKQSICRKFPIHEELAKIFREDPKTVRLVARRLLSEIKRLNPDTASAQQCWEWYAILTLWPVPEIIRLLGSRNLEGSRLRQSAQCLDLLTSQERSPYAPATAR